MVLGENVISYKYLKPGIIFALVLMAIVFSGLMSGINFLNLNQVVIPSPLKWILIAVVLYIAYIIKEIF